MAGSRRYLITRVCSIYPCHIIFLFLCRSLTAREQEIECNMTIKYVSQAFENDETVETSGPNKAVPPNQTSGATLGGLVLNSYIQKG